MGVGTAGGAATIVNAMATGRGAAYGLAYRVRAEVIPTDRWSVHANGRRLPLDEARLATAAAEAVRRGAPRERPWRIRVQSEIPPSRGLKSSSAVAVAVIRAAAHELGQRWTNEGILEAAAEAGIASGTSLTGAFDDAAACLLGGVVVTDNRRRRIVARSDLPRGLEALVRIPRRKRPTASVRHTDFSRIEELINVAWRLARSGNLRDALLLNSAAYGSVLGHDDRFVVDALDARCFAAGLSGKGPAHVALGDAAAVRRLHRLYPACGRIALRRGGAP